MPPDENNAPELFGQTVEELEALLAESEKKDNTEEKSIEIPAKDEDNEEQTESTVETEETEDTPETGTKAVKETEVTDKVTQKRLADKDRYIKQLEQNINLLQTDMANSKAKLDALSIKSQEGEFDFDNPEEAVARVLQKEQEKKELNKSIEETQRQTMRATNKVNLLTRDAEIEETFSDIEVLLKDRGFNDKVVKEFANDPFAWDPGTVYSLSGWTKANKQVKALESEITKLTAQLNMSESEIEATLTNIEKATKKGVSLVKSVKGTNATKANVIGAAEVWNKEVTGDTLTALAKKLGLREYPQ